MYPSIREGELITVEPVEPGNAKRGDIVLYRSEREPTAHRVIEVNRPQAEIRAFRAAGFGLRAPTVWPVGPQTPGKPNFTKCEPPLTFWV